MLIDRQNMVYRNGLLAEAHRFRVSNVPLRYQSSWTVRRIVELNEHQVVLHAQHSIITDDSGNRVVFTCTQELGVGLTKRQAMAMLDHANKSDHSTAGGSLSMKV
jgi:hypothetical protein